MLYYSCNNYSWNEEKDKKIRNKGMQRIAQY